MTSNVDVEPDRPVSTNSSRARWGLLAALVIQVATVVSTVVPAHFLSPREFALVGASTVVAGLFGILADGGYGNAIIASDSADNVKISSTFWSGIGIASGLAALIVLTSPWTARLIGSPNATPYIAASAVLVPAGTAAAVLESVHFRRFNHRVAFLAQIAQAVVAAVVPIALVLNGVGAWALIIGRVAGSFTIVAFLLVVGKVWPSFVFDRQMVKDDLAFNSGSMGSNVITYGAKNLDYWVLGHFVSASAFGGYYVAFVVPQVLRQRVTWLNNQLLFPVLARIRDEPEAFRARYLEGLQFVAAVVIPALVGVSVTADLVVRLAFGSSWGSAVAPLRILALASSIDVVSAVSVTVLLARREISGVAFQQMVRLGALAACLVAVPFVRDVRVAALAVLASGAAGMVASVASLRSRGVATAWQQVHTLIPVVVPTAAMAASVLVARSFLTADLPYVAELAVVGIGGAAAYLGVGLILFPKVFAGLLRRGRSIAGR